MRVGDIYNKVPAASAGASRRRPAHGLPSRRSRGARFADRIGQAIALLALFAGLALAAVLLVRCAAEDALHREVPGGTRESSP